MHGGTCIIYTVSQIKYTLTMSTHQVQIEFWTKVLIFLHDHFGFKNNLHSLPDGAHKQCLCKIPQGQLKPRNLIAGKT